MSGVETDAVRVQLADELTETRAERDAWQRLAVEAMEVAHAAMIATGWTEPAPVIAAGPAPWARGRSVKAKRA